MQPSYPNDKMEDARPEAEKFWKAKVEESLARIDNRAVAECFEFDKHFKITNTAESGGLWDRSGRRSWQLLVNYSTRSTYGDTKIKLRKDGTINEELLDTAIHGHAWRIFRTLAADRARQHNKKALKALSPDVAKHLKPTSREGLFEISMRSLHLHMKASFVTLETAQKVVPAYLKAEREIERILT